ncbi:MAG: hypothetical protein AB200_03150, partial [Parcubacteria bacterium C7867-005]
MKSSKSLKTHIRIFFALVLLVSLFAQSTRTINAAEVPSMIGYQGRLTDSSGNLVGGTAGAIYYFRFSLWNNATVGNGSRVWPSSSPSDFSTTVRQGVFNVNIGDVVNGYPDALDYDFSASNIYLQIEVSSNGVSFETLSPRQSISSSVFSQKSGSVSGTGQSSIGTTTPSSGAVLTVVSTTTASSPLVIIGAPGQSANLFDIRNSSGSSLFSVSSTGGVLSSGIGSFSNLLTTGSSTLQNFTALNSTTTNASTTNLSVASFFTGAGLSSCAAGTDKLLWSNGQFTCGTDAGSVGSGITSVGAQYSSAQGGAGQTFATTSDTNLRLTITSSGDIHTFTPSWTGTLA